MKTTILLFGFLFSLSAMGQTPIPTDTYFSYPMDGNATDVSGANLTGTIVGGVTATADRLGNPTGALLFNGTNGYIDIPYSTSVGTADFSVSYWANPSASNAGFVLSKEQSGVAPNQFRVGSSGDYFGCFADNTNTYGGGLAFTPTVNIWSFYTITRQGNSIKLYVNGVYKSALTTAGTINHLNALNYRIGAVYNGSIYFNGKIDDLRMFQHALTTDEITALYNYVEPTTLVDPPVITSFSPLNGSIGSTVTITGTGFNSTLADNVVRFGSVKATVTSATPTQLTVIVPEGTTYQNITITDLSTSLTGYSSTPFIITSFSCGAISCGSFSNKMNITSDPMYQNVNACDLDGDGKSDLVCVDENYKITTFRNTSTVGNISFLASSNYVTGLSIQLSTGDLNGDGKTDLVVTNSNGTVSIYLNTSVPGSISFAPKVDYTFTTGSQKTAINDLDGDGKPDLAIISVGNSVSVLRNTSTIGTLSFAPKIDLITGIQVSNIEIGDLDGDKKPDIAITYWGNIISAFRNTSVKGTISFASKVDFTVGDYPQSISIGDLDGDGKPDLAISNAYLGVVSLLRNTSTLGVISFAPKNDYTFAHGTNGVSIGDLDGDGKLDFVVLDDYNVSVLRNTSISGTFSFVLKYVVYGDSWPSWCASICDFDGDEKPDIAVAYEYISVLRNLGYVPGIATINTSVVTESLFNITPVEEGSNAVPVGTTYTWTVPSVTGSMTGGASGSGTSISGTLINHSRTDQIAIYTVTPTSSCGTGLPFNIVLTVKPLPFTITSFTPVNSNIGSTVTITGTGFDSTPANYEVRFGDIKAEIIAATYTSFTVVVPVGATYDKISITDKITGSLIYSPLFFHPTFMCGGAINSSTFDVRKDFNTGSGSKKIEVGDLDGDKKTDVAIIYSQGITSSVLSILRNTSTSEEISFAPEVNYLTGATPISIAIGDLDGDGKPDIALANYFDRTVSVFHNTSVIGTISFAPKVDYTVGIWANCVRIADWDNDGKPDLLISSSFTGTTSSYSKISAFYNISTIGTISFTTRDDDIGEAMSSFSVGNIDGNRMNDFVATYNYGVYVFYNHNHNHRFNNSWRITSIYPMSTYTQGQMIGDWDGDNKPDIAVISSDKLMLMKNTGVLNTDDNVTFPSFTPTYTTYTLNSGNDIKTGDLDGDGKLDIALVSSDKSISVFRNTTTNDSISFARQDYPLTSSSNSFAIGDLNSDGKPDMIIATETGFSVFKNLGAVPVINKMTVTVNSDSVFSITPQDVIDGLVPSGTTYMWTTPTVTADVTGGVDGSGTSISGKLTNHTLIAQNTIYMVTPGCSGSPFSLNVIVKPPINTGLVNNEDRLTTLSLTPNPTSKGFTINAGDQKSILSIYDLSGSLMLTKQISGKSYIDVTTLPSGVYMVKTNGRIGKLIKK